MTMGLERRRRRRRRALHDAGHGRGRCPASPASPRSPSGSATRAAPPADATDRRSRALPAIAHGLHGLHRSARRARARRLARQGRFEKFSQLLYVLTALALARRPRAGGEHDDHDRRRADARDRPDEGDRRHRAARSGRSTCAPLSSLGAIASLIGAALGVGIANLVTNYFGSSFYGMPAQLGVYWPVLAASILVGLVGPMLASLPAIRRAVRVPVREALEATGAEVGQLDPARPDAAPRGVHAADVPSRRAQRRPPEAQEPGDDPADRLRRRDAARGARPRHLDRQPHAQRLERPSVGDLGRLEHAPAVRRARRVADPLDARRRRRAARDHRTR